MTAISKSFTLLFDVRPAGRPWFSPCNFVKQQAVPVIILALFQSNTPESLAQCNREHAAVAVISEPAVQTRRLVLGMSLSQMLLYCW